MSFIFTGLNNSEEFLVDELLLNAGFPAKLC